jgi:hypothetical protein
VSAAASASAVCFDIIAAPHEYFDQTASATLIRRWLRRSATFNFARARKKRMRHYFRATHNFLALTSALR